MDNLRAKYFYTKKVFSSSIFIEMSNSSMNILKMAYIQKWSIEVLVTMCIILLMTGCTGMWDDIPAVPEGYQENFSYEGELEKKYAYDGSYQTEFFSQASSHKKIRLLQVWYPTELKSSERRWPVVVMANGSGTEASRYKAILKHLASWGFIVVGNQDNSSWSGETTSLTLDFILKQDQQKDSIFYGKINTEKIGLSGHSQGAVAVFNAVTKYPNGRYYKAICAQSCVNMNAAKFLKWPYSVDDVKVPTLAMAGVGKSDDETVCPLSTLNYFADHIKAPALIGRLKDITHERVLMKGNAYTTAWMLYWLYDDPEAGKCFIGSDAEILKNKGWRNVKQKKL